ncbi:MAG TPA: 4-oxalocrotonate tautomerase family protein [Devosia sp.]|nr:4-oxalocrotonate tautomerase family protein [Devosia sp.]
MPYVNVRISADGNTAEQKERVIARITQVLVEELGKDPAGTFVVIDEVSTDNWGHYGTTVTKLRAAKKAAAKSSPGKAAARVSGTSARKSAARKG